MELFLSKQCESLTGSLGRQFGYHVKHTKNGFFVARNTNGYVPPDGHWKMICACANGNVPPDGHWKMICACANLAEMKLHVAGLKVYVEEVTDALKEAGLTTPAYCLYAYPADYPQVFNEYDIINLKKRFNL